MDTNVLQVRLGYTLRRIWHDEPDYANNYTPLALEVLEDRQMLSGFGGDDPTGGGTGDTGGSGGSGDAGEFDNGPGSGANGGAIAGGNNEVTEVNGTSPGAGYSEYSALTLSTHWRTNAPASYAWNQIQTLPSYFGTHASGSNSGTVYHAEVKGFDTDLGTYLISFYTYNYTITVSRSSDLGGMGGPGQFGTSDWYKEHLSVTVTGSTIETTDQLIANDFLDNGQFDNFNSASFKSIGTHSGNANYTFTGTVNPNTSNTYSQIDVVLGEYFQQNYNYQTTVDSFWDRSGLPGNVEVSGTVQVSGGSHSHRNTTFDSNQTATGRNFNVNGSSSGASNDTINYQNASLTITTAGFEPVAIDNTTATMRPRNDDGTYATPPVEGSRYQLTLHGTQTTTSNFNTNFSGNGHILPQGSKTVRTGTVHYSANANSTITNDYVRTYTADQTILGATILYATSLQSGQVARSIEKGGGQEIDIAVLHSYSQTTDKNRSESELKYNLKHEYQNDGNVKQTTQMVNSLTGLGLSFYRLKDDYNIETTYREIEQLQYNKPTENSTEFTRTHGSTKLTGPSSRLTTFATTITSAQPGFTHETTSTGQVFVTGTTDLTNVATSTTIRSFKKQASVSMPAATAIELTLNGDGSVTSPPPMTGERKSSLDTTVASGSTRRLHDTILRHWIYEADGVVKAHEDSTFRSYNTAYWGTFDSTVKTSLDAADNVGNKHSDAYEQVFTTTTTAHGLGSMSDLQDFWGSGDGSAIAAAAVGEASIVMQSLVITFTPRPTPPNEDDQDDDLQAVALGGSSSRAYDRTKSGTSTHIRAGSYSDAGHDEGFDRISGVRVTTASATTISTHSDRDSWNKTPEGEHSSSLTDVYSFSADDSFTIHTTGWSDVVGTDDGNVGYHTALGSQTGNAEQGSAMQAIAADGQVVATDAQWNALADQMNDDSFDGFSEDFSLSRLIDTRDSSELSRDGLRTEYNLTRIFTPKTFEVPVTSSDGTTGTDGTGGAQTTVSSEGSTETRTVDGYEITNFGSTKVVVTSSYSIQHNSGHTELLYARQQSGGTYQYVPGQGFGTGANYRWLSNGRSTTDLASGGNSESYSSNATITTTYNSDGLIVIHTVSDLESHTQSLATAKTTTSDRLWQDDYAAGHGRIAAARSSSLPPDGPNLSSSSNYKYDSDLTLVINPNLFPPTTPGDSSSGSSGSSGSYDPNGGQSNYTPSGSGSSGSGSSSSGSSSPANQGPNGPNLGEMYGNMRYGISQWDASDKGF
ncbi:MAG: hypothetical protein Q8M16_02405, partial [Pirellulaceae bacterium]|nr:hypothetical protein [Pirellulaceae bacterium]